MFKVRVKGDYVARSGVMDKEKVKRTYEVEGVIPTLTAALSVVKNKLLGPALAKKYPDYVTFLTYHIIEITPLTPAATEQMSKAEVQFMDRPTLLKHIKDLALPVDAAYFPDLFKLREAVIHAKEDEKGFTRWFDLRKEDLALDLQMAAANPELFNQDGQAAPELIASVSSPVSGIKALKGKAKAKQTGQRVDGLAAEMKRDGDMLPDDL